MWKKRVTEKIISMKGKGVGEFGDIFEKFRLDF